MKKQELLQREIRTLVNLQLSNIEPRRASAESKQMDMQGLEAGLAYIGLELEHAEREIAKIWSLYEGNSTVASINYPRDFSLKTEEDRRREAKETLALLPTLPSETFRKVLAREVAISLTAGKVSNEELERIQKELRDAPQIVVDPETIIKDHENGFVSTKTASVMRGYAEDESEKAAIDHAERATRVLNAQTNMAARGMPDLAVEPVQEAKEEKNG